MWNKSQTNALVSTHPHHLEVNSVNISVNILRQIIMAYYKKQTSMSLSLQLPSLNAVCVRVWVISAEIQLESQVLKIRT